MTIQNEPACERYWHDTEPTEYGNVTVSQLNSCVMTDWIVREFIIWVSKSLHIQGAPRFIGYSCYVVL